MADNSVNISIPLRFEIKSPPRGMLDYDPKALSTEQQEELNAYKISIRKDNNIYLADHPEVKALLAFVVRSVRTYNPRNMFKFVSELFNRPERELREEIQIIMKETPVQKEVIPYCDYEDWDI